MKYINKISLVLILTIFIGFGFSSCTVEDPVVIKPKSMDQYIKDFAQFVTSERMLLDSVKSGYLTGNYNHTQDSLNHTQFLTLKAQYLAALKADSALLVKPGVTLAELVNANKNLCYMGGTFKTKINLCDRQDLADSMKLAYKLILYTSSYTGFGAAGGKIMPYDKTLFSAVYTAGTLARDSANAIRAQVMRSLTNLSTAKVTFLKAIIPTDLTTYKQTCKTFVDAQLSKCYQVTVGYNLYEYAPNNRNNLLTALRADSVLIGTDAVPGTATTVDLLAAGMYNLTKTPGNFYQNFQQNATDRRVLADSIASALTLYNNTPYAPTPTVSGQVPTYARTNFMTAITSATTKRDNPLTIDTDVTGAIFGLYNAKLLFVSLIKK